MLVAACWLRHAGCGMLVAASWRQHAGYSMLVAACWLRHAGRGKLAAACWLQHAGCGRLVAACWLRHAGCGMLVAACWLRHTSCGMLVAGCGGTLAGGCRLRHAVACFKPLICSPKNTSGGESRGYTYLDRAAPEVHFRMHVILNCLPPHLGYPVKE